MSSTDIEIIVEFEDAQTAQKLFHYAKKYSKKKVPFSSVDQAIRLLAEEKDSTTPTYLPNPLESEHRAVMVPKYGAIDYPMDKDDFADVHPDELRLNLESVTVNKPGIVSIKFFTVKHFLSDDLVETILSWFKLPDVNLSEVAFINDFDGCMKRFRADHNGYCCYDGIAWDEEPIEWKGYTHILKQQV